MLEEKAATHSSIVAWEYAWEIPRTDGLQSLGLEELDTTEQLSTRMQFLMAVDSQGVRKAQLWYMDLR